MKNKLSEIKVSYTAPTNIEPVKIVSSKDAYEALLQSWDLDTLELQEEFKVLLLNRANQVLGVYHLSKGGVSGTVVDAKLLFATALKCMASSIVLGHNHPSGNLTPSVADTELTRKIKQAGELLDISVLDHLLITRNGYYSFADEGKL